MKAQVLQSWGGRLTLVDRPRPAPQAGEVLVAVRACGVEEVFGLCDEGAVRGSAGDGDAAAPAELEKAFIAELAECA